MGILANDPTPEAVYRFFGQEDWAEDFLNGNVWVATLDDFRQREEVRRGDADEGYEARTFRGAGGGNDSKFVRDASLVGASISEGSRNISLSIEYQHRLPNCWVICTTPVFLPEEMVEYGQFCVEISDVRAFHDAVGKALSSVIGEEYDWMVTGWRGYVRYQSREIDVTVEECGPIGFVKPDIPEFVRDREYRLLYAPLAPLGESRGQVPQVAGRLLHIPELRNIVRRVS